jgi:integration host factor subunit alpha
LTNRETSPLTRAELIEAVRQQVGLSHRDAGEILETMLNCISEVIAGGGQVYFNEVGRFRVRFTRPRPGRNPKTGVAAQVPARNRPTFTMSPSLRAELRLFMNQMELNKIDAAPGGPTGDESDSLNSWDDGPGPQKS